MSEEIKEQKKTNEKKLDTTDIPAFKASKFCLFTFTPVFATFFENIP